METPSSTRRVTRSQTLAANNGIPVSSSKSKQRSGALIDITNDSPIVGLANGVNVETQTQTPMAMAKQRVKNTPGSGEALLRGQVKTLLQKVEEEADLSLETRPFLRLINSPMAMGMVGLLAPTPANTPQIQNLSVSANTPSPLIPEAVSHMFDGNGNGKNEEDSESEKSVISRSLLLDFSDKSQEEVAQGDGGGGSRPSATTEEDDDASVWSIQVNAEDDDNDGGLLLDELCQGLYSISVNERAAPKFEGKHTRFVYNSDDELVKEEEVQNSASASPDVLRLKGLPTPKGKHLRFSEEEEGR